MQKNNYVNPNTRIVVDIDNDRKYQHDILGLTQTDEVKDFEGRTVLLTEGDYIYTITENYEDNEPSHILAEGYVIKNPFEDSPLRWCCKLVGDIEYLEDYQKRFGRK